MDEPIDFGSTDIPWPQKGDLLFIPGDDWWNNACVNYSPGAWYQYIIGYKRAAERLCDSLASDRSYADFLVYPIIFLYRQYIELILKYLLLRGKPLFNEKFDLKNANHEIPPLWKECCGVLRRTFPNDTTLEHDIECIDGIISQLTTIDKSSMTFRYPVDKDGNPMLTSTIKLINLRNLSEVMRRVATFFDSASMAIDHEHQTLQDMEQEARYWEQQWEEYIE
jgi:hypothetical protein